MTINILSLRYSWLRLLFENWLKYKRAYRLSNRLCNYFRIYSYNVAGYYVLPKEYSSRMLYTKIKRKSEFRTVSETNRPS